LNFLIIYIRYVNFIG